MSRIIDILIFLLGGLTILWGIVAKHPFWGMVLLGVIMLALYRLNHPDKSVAVILAKFFSRGMTDEEAESLVTGRLSQKELDRQATYELARPKRERIAREREEQARKSFIGRFLTQPLMRWFDRITEIQQAAKDAKALLDLKVAAAKGDAASQYSMGLHYEQGAGTQQDIPAAVEWYRKAAAQGHPDATGRLALLDKP